MAYSINIIQRVSDGDILGACGCTFIPITSQASYQNALFIGGDPNQVPDNYSGLPNGDYRVMTFFTQGRKGSDFPIYNGVPFSNFVDQSAGNQVDIVLGNEGFAYPLGSEDGFAQWSSEWYANGNGPSFFMFTEEQYVTYELVGANLWQNNRYFEFAPSFAGFFAMEAYPEAPSFAFGVGGFSSQGIVEISGVSWAVINRG